MVKRSDITLSEDVDYALDDIISYSDWTAELDGYLPSGERVQMARSGGTAAEALDALKSAIEGCGWTLEDA
ncbi:hypothetical protein AOA12_06155 [Microbacterium sp. No. 7]|nr:hypothetical protein AOA12_06155 [Microbacterium sp. No. 7]